MTESSATESTATQPSPTVEAFVERFLDAVVGAQDMQAAYLGHRLGWYRALAGGEALTSGELAERTGTAERYAREWLEHQAVSGVLTVDDTAAPAAARRFALPPAHAEALTDERSLNYVLPLAHAVVGFGKHMDRLVDAYRTGGGVSWAEMGDDSREAQGATNRPVFLGPLGSAYLPGIPDVDDALRAGGRVADVGSGVGWSSIGIALAYPEATVDGFDLDTASVEAARRNAEESGVADRVCFSAGDAAAAAGDEPYDLVAAFECVHDMSDPVSVLAAMRALAGGRGAVLVLDERVAEKFAVPSDPGERMVERMMYGWSLICCLPDGLSHSPSVGTGTVMRASTLRAYARDAGFADVTEVPIENDFFRLYRLS